MRIIRTLLMVIGAVTTLAVVATVAGLVFFSMRTPPVPEKTVLTLDLDRDVAEYGSGGFGSWIALGKSPPTLWETVAAIERLFNDHLLLLTSRFLVAQLGPLLLSYMIWKTLADFKNTMAATGLFYIALLGVFVGELLSSQILALTLVGG